MKRILLCLLLACSLVSKAQVYNNEWIDHNKTYYKFKLRNTGLYRISQAVLSNAGLGAAPAEDFQLWRNGVQLPIYTSVAIGALSPTDYIEFWGKMNDGKPDKDLYRNPNHQLSDYWSLQTDTATYFLTVNPGGNNLRLAPVPNNIAGNTLSPEPYFMHTAGVYFKNKINGGYAVHVDNQYLYSSSYDKGEGYTSADITSNANLPTQNLTNLQVYATGPACTFNIALSGNAIASRKYLVRINNDSITGGDLDFYNDAKSSGTFPASLISSGTASVVVRNVCNQTPCPTSDRMVVHKLELNYPRRFHFGGAANFEFSLPASSAGNYLEIQSFSTGNVPPVLYDLTNGKRYVADISVASLVRVRLEPSATERKLVLVSEAVTNINNVLTLQSKVFKNYTLSENQGDYLIISHPLLLNGTNSTNPVEDYRAYRASAPGGSYNSKIYLVDDLIDQFGFGIKNHPVAIRNFILFSRNNFSPSPKHVFLIGKGVEYNVRGTGEFNANTDRLNLVPAFGVPASDVLLAADRGSSLAKVSIGRISAVYPKEVTDYLEKVKQSELELTNLSPKTEDRSWTKNVLHLSGGAGEQSLAMLLGGYMREYKRKISDTLFGGRVYSISKETSNTVEQLNNSVLPQLFEQGLSLLTYFGHSSSTTLEFNVEDPGVYNNKGKYPLFLALGCNAGNIFGNNTNRLNATNATSENYIFYPQKGAVGFIASTHFGLVHYLNIWAGRFYESFSSKDYGRTIGEILNFTASRVFDYTSQDDFYSRANVEELALLGDPAIVINHHQKPDYAIEDAMVKMNPFISVTETSFKVQIKSMNLGKAVNTPIVMEIRHEGPDQTSKIVFRDTIQGIRYADSLMVDIPVDVDRERGSNKLTITIDADNAVDELYETNNSITKEYVIYEDEAKPVYPYDFSIINKQAIKFYASSANPLLGGRTYEMQIDTTMQFNSTLKTSTTITSSGGVLEFSPNVTFRDSTVYYWRVGALQNNSDTKWSTASFIYMNQNDVGYNQSHLYQHLKSDTADVSLDLANKVWKFGNKSTNVYVENGVYPRAGSVDLDFTVSVEGDPYIRSFCVGHSLAFNIFDPNTGKPVENLTGRYGSALPCQPTRRWNFEYSLTTAASRKKIMDFMDSIPEGYYVVVRNSVNTSQTKGFVSEWKSDTTLYGSSNSLYHKLLAVGFELGDSFKELRAFAHIYRKGVNSFKPVSVMSQGSFDKVSLGAELLTPKPLGYITSPVFGPAKQWKEFLWEGEDVETSGDKPVVDIIGVRNDGTKDVLFANIDLNQKKVDISSIDPVTYPNVQLKMTNVDSVNYTPYQLKHWRLTYDPVPEGLVAPNLHLTMKDTLEVNEPLTFKIAFKNISESPFDSLRVKLAITDRNNVTHPLSNNKHKPLAASDTLLFEYNIDTKSFVGNNRLFVEMNPDNDQPEKYLFNNFLYKEFYVKGDSINPFIDITFDNRHILNNDIVSSKPDIIIKLKDDAKWMLLDDTSLVNIQLRYPDGTTKTFTNFDNDTLSFNKSQQPSQTDNTATINFRPYLTEDGTYELIVKGTDKSNNKTGALEYKVAFQVINKPMISNLLNYPNPFTTSTAFVFTLTGSEIPQNLKIQILTVTGKVVREITKQELGPLQIGKNITEFKWDGTDQYGQKLANGVYLYRVITNLNGKSLHKYKAEGDNTDKYFNKGYGKMYLMR